MSSPDRATITHLLENGPHRQEVGGKQLTLALGGQYIVSTTTAAKPLLVWESEKTYYARYYVPVKALHPSLSVEVIDTIRAKNNDAQAQVEKVSVGQKSTTWVRFKGGKLDGFIRFERNEIDDWFENGALFASIKNPYKRIDTATVSHDIVVKIDGEEVATTNAAVLLNETGLKDAYYLPATSIKDWGNIEKTDLRTICPYKGEAAYLSITVKGKKHDNFIWYYPYPTHESAAVGGLISFYNKENVDILVDGVKV